MIKLKIIILCNCILSLVIATYYLNYKYEKSRLKKVFSHIDFILVKKENRSMIVYNQGQVLKKYRIALGGDPIGHKKYEGDSKTPEGNYVISYKNPRSRYHLSLKISYPNEKDKLRASDKGMSPGDFIMIHGIGFSGNFKLLVNYFFNKDWTKGCIAVTNEEIEKIYTAVELGTKIKIVP